MKTFPKILTEDLLNECLKELEKNLRENTWRISENFWGENIRKGVTGICAQHLVSDELSEKLQAVLRTCVPGCQRMVFQFYTWYKNSGIPLHEDRPYKWGATIYLNVDWDLDWGGLFVWKDKEEELRVLCPEINTMVLNDEREPHLVTMVSPLSPQARRTIQIWGI